MYPQFSDLVDDHFSFIQSLKDNNGDPYYLVDVIPEFCTNARDVLKLLIKKLNDPVLNYDFMKEHVFKVKGSALSIGARRMALTFAEFEDAIEKASKEECMKALNQARREYCALEQKLHIVLQLERRIILLTKQRPIF
ncbi:PREDICTED: histidine-containing phosphotransfer protein 2-like [Lupinus angustifolius]|uniref:histidine-containing phosphotransfer protein 2-like n=1 Tax=Lupinus angustifolius TaxID=3871 RepID=UPI00092EAC22|nr:PREDICTED: histidine-containing phosphotransfer protein 2-like [Lupinus angustifolius]